MPKQKTTRKSKPKKIDFAAFDAKLNKATSTTRNVAFVTGTRAEFGLMQSVIRAINAHDDLNFQLIVTGVHLDRAHGRTLKQLKKDGWKIDAVVPWQPARQNLSTLAQQTGHGLTKIASALERIGTDIVLCVGDRVEAFAAAAAGHISGRVVAHVHGGDRAQGQVDDSLRHAASKLAHVHFPATEESAKRLEKLGEDKWRIHTVGAPGIDDIEQLAWPIAKSLKLFEKSVPPAKLGKFALVLYHPTDPSDVHEYRCAKLILEAVQSAPFDHIIIVHPNNDPGATGILRCWTEAAQQPNILTIPDLTRPAFLGLLREAAVLVGNSSSGIIEAASFGTPVIDAGPRQEGRQRGENVTTVELEAEALKKAVKKVWNGGKPVRYSRKNLYGTGTAGKQIAKILAEIPINPKLTRKLITY